MRLTCFCHGVEFTLAALPGDPQATLHPGARYEPAVQQLETSRTQTIHAARFTRWADPSKCMADNSSMSLRYQLVVADDTAGHPALLPMRARRLAYCPRLNAATASSRNPRSAASSPSCSTMDPAAILSA